MEPICYIAGAMARELHIRKRPGDLLIAADAGLTAVREPDLIVGDFDSLGHVPEGDNVVRHPVKKDDTDMLLAIRLGLERGYRAFYLYGGVGGRTDHTLANLQSLAFLLERGAYGYLFGERETFTLLQREELRFPACCRGIFSAFAFGGEAAGVTLEGFLYPLADARLTPSFPLAVSNEFTGLPARACVKSGRLLAVWEAGNPLPERKPPAGGTA